jgi:hypothetical protein
MEAGGPIPLVSKFVHEIGQLTETTVDIPYDIELFHGLLVA